MSEAAGRRAEVERRLVERSVRDGAFRQQLLADPKAATAFATEGRCGCRARPPHRAFDEARRTLAPREAAAGVGL